MSVVRSISQFPRPVHRLLLRAQQRVTARVIAELPATSRTYAENGSSGSDL